MERKKRSNGEESRDRILDAAAEIAAIRGYEGTSIGAVSKSSGLPASSIYWHFKDKDDLIAAVIERSFARWLTAVTAVEGIDADSYAHVMAQQTLKGLEDAPDFLRLGLMLVLERRPEEPRARELFLEIRHNARALIAERLFAQYPGLTESDIAQLATFAVAGADGLFIAHEALGDAVDLVTQFDYLATSVTNLANSLSTKDSK